MPAAKVLPGYREAVSEAILVVSARNGSVSAWEDASKDEERWQAPRVYLGGMDRTW